MAEHVGESCDVVKSFIENGGKKMAQVVRKDFAWRDACFFCEVFHFGPHLVAGHRFSVCVEKDLSVGDFFQSGVVGEFFAELGRDEDGADLSFEMDIGAAARDRFGGDGGKLADADACGANGLNDEGDAPPATRTRGAGASDIPNG